MKCTAVHGFQTRGLRNCGRHHRSATQCILENRVTSRRAKRTFALPRVNTPDNPDGGSELPDVPTFEVEPEETFEVDDPELAALIRRAAAARRMDPSAYLSILLTCDVRGTVPLWRKVRES